MPEVCSKREPDSSPLKLPLQIFLYNKYKWVDILNNLISKTTNVSVISIAQSLACLLTSVIHSSHFASKLNEAVLWEFAEFLEELRTFWLWVGFTAMFIGQHIHLSNCIDLLCTEQSSYCWHEIHTHIQWYILCICILDWK